MTAVSDPQRKFTDADIWNLFMADRWKNPEEFLHFHKLNQTTEGLLDEYLSFMARWRMMPELDPCLRDALLRVLTEAEKKMEGG